MLLKLPDIVSDWLEEIVVLVTFLVDGRYRDTNEEKLVAAPLSDDIRTDCSCKIGCSVLTIFNALENLDELFLDGRGNQVLDQHIGRAVLFLFLQ